MDPLPVDEIRDQVTRALSARQPLIVTAPTGSGKSTRLPGWLAEDTSSRVMVVEPRRVACRSLARYLASQAGERPGQSVGYSIRFEDVRGPDTQIVFVTPGVALRMLSDADDFEFGAVLVDEFHERGWEVDLITAILRQRQQQGDRGLPVVFTSATLDVDELVGALDATVLEAKGRTYPVEISYQGQAGMPSSQDLAERVERAVRGALDSEDDGEILVFLPGKGEIADCERQLGGLARRHSEIELLQVHASLPMRRLMRAFEDPKPGRRRIFLATNVAETSVTLPGVTWVIDSGLVRMQLHRAGRAALALTAASLDSMDQRAGRAGRVKPGRCIRLWERQWSPSATTPPEIERIELDDVLVRAAACGLEGATFDQAPWVTQPPTFAVERAREQLQRIRALDARGHLTEIGAQLGQMPVSAHEARVLLDPPRDLASAAADLVAILQRGTRMMLPPGRAGGDTGRIKAARAELFEGVRDEVTEAIVALRRGQARRHGIHGAALKETRRISTSLRKILGVRPTNPTRDTDPPPDPERLAAYVLERVPEMGFVLRERAKNKRSRRRGRSQPWANGAVEVQVDPYVPHNEDDHLEPHQRPVAGALLDHTWLGDRKGYGVHGFGRMLLPCSLDTMADHVDGERAVGDPKVRRRRGVRVEAPVRQELAGVVLRERVERLTGRALCQAVAGLILQNRVLKGAAGPVQDALHLWKIARDFEPGVEHAHWDLEAVRERELPEVEVYLAERLAELGLERSEELALIEPEDLLPDLAGQLGTMPYELEQLLEELPRTWEHLGAVYSVTPSPLARRVTLEPANKAARRAGEPARDVLPRFRGWRVVYRQDSRVFTLRG